MGRTIRPAVHCRSMSISFTQGGGEVRLTFAPNVRYMPYGKGFILRDHSIEEADGARYLRLYGDDGLLIRLLIEEGDLEPAHPGTEFTEPVEYIKDKIITG